jgi:hypothetical protein
MQLSTDLPSGPSAARNHITTRGENPLSRNVSREADLAFMTELARTDPARYARLEKSIQTAALRQQRERRCEQCNLVLPFDTRKALYCDSACKKASQRSKAA